MRWTKGIVHSMGVHEKEVGVGMNKAPWVMYGQNQGCKGTGNTKDVKSTKVCGGRGWTDNDSVVLHQG